MAAAGYRQGSGWLRFARTDNLASMCGRITQRFSRPEIVAMIRLEVPSRDLQPRYNLAPGRDAAVLRVEREELRLVMLCWGLVPRWAKDPVIGSRLINARAETATEKPAFRSVWEAWRCLVLAYGFYEWRRGSRAPWLFQPRDAPVMALAGLWKRWHAPDDRFTACPVSPRVNHPRHDDPECVSAFQVMKLLLPF